MNTRYLHVARLVVITLLATAVSDLFAQSPPAARFEVASVKPTPSPAQAGQAIGQAVRNGTAPPPVPAIPVGVRTSPGGTFTFRGSLRTLVAWAYDVKEYQVEGGPNWVGDDFYVVDARAGREATSAEFREMVKTLLAERFGFRGGPTTRPGKTFSLVRARPDGKLAAALTPTSPECLAEIEKRGGEPPPALPRPTQPSNRTPSGQPDAPPRCGTSRSSVGILMGGATTWSAQGRPIADLVQRLVSELNTTVVDRTGLEGLFDFVVESDRPSPLAALIPGKPLDPNSTDSPPLPLQHAIEGQLGLKLEAAEGSVPVIVIDAVERPTAN